MEKNKMTLPARRTYNCKRCPKVKFLSDEEVTGPTSRLERRFTGSSSRNTSGATSQGHIRTNLNPVFLSFSETSSKEPVRTPQALPPLKRRATARAALHDQIPTNLISVVPKISEVPRKEPMKTPQALPPLESRESRATSQAALHVPKISEVPHKEPMKTPPSLQSTTQEPGHGSQEAGQNPHPVLQSTSIHRSALARKRKSASLISHPHEMSAGSEPGSSLRCPINLDNEIISEPTSEDCWKGTFEIIGHDSNVTFVYDSIQARLSTKAAQIACEISKRMPERLQFKMLQRKEVWPKPFKQDPPDTDDIGVYFFASDIERPKQKFNLLLNFVNLHDFAMRSQIGDVDLLLFTSMQLTEDSRSKISEEAYMWGIFRHIKHRKPIQRVPGLLLPHSAAGGGDDGAALMGDKIQSNISLGDNTEVDMEIDMIGGIEIGRVDKPIPRI